MIIGLAACAGAGALLSLAFPKVQFPWLAWIAFVPVFWALDRESRAGWAALHGWVFGLVFFLADLNWILSTLVTYGGFAWITALFVFLGMVTFLALFPAVFAVALNRLNRRGMGPFVMAPFVWTGLEYIRTVALTGFPWDLTGYSQTDFLMLMQLVDTTGIYGISFLIVMVNVALWGLLAAWISGGPVPWRTILCTALPIAIVLIYGSVRLKQYPPTGDLADGLAVGILQGNIDQHVKWERGAREFTFFTYERLGRQAVGRGARLLIWPETSLPVLFGGDDLDWTRAGIISSRLGVPMVVGAPTFRTVGERTRYYNSALLLNGHEVIRQYDKIHLVPFGEYMPLTWLLPLGPGIAAREGDYSAGERMEVMHVEGAPPFGVLICYEAIFPDLSRWAVAQGATMLVNLTNDGWYGRSAAPYQHLELARVRSIENRVWLVRAANTGISAVFDPAGRLVASMDLQKEGEMAVKVPREVSAGSFYSRFGDLFAWACLGVWILAALPVNGIRARLGIGSR